MARAREYDLNNLRDESLFRANLAVSSILNAPLVLSEDEIELFAEDLTGPLSFQDQPDGAPLDAADMNVDDEHHNNFYLEPYTEEEEETILKELRDRSIAAADIASEELQARGITAWQIERYEQQGGDLGWAQIYIRYCPNTVPTQQAWRNIAEHPIPSAWSIAAMMAYMLKGVETLGLTPEQVYTTPFGEQQFNAAKDWLRAQKDATTAAFMQSQTGVEYLTDISPYLNEANIAALRRTTRDFHNSRAPHTPDDPQGRGR